jgi:hypothetical protein
MKTASSGHILKMGAYWSAGCIQGGRKPACFPLQPFMRQPHSSWLSWQGNRGSLGTPACGIPTENPGKKKELLPNTPENINLLVPKTYAFNFFFVRTFEKNTMQVWRNML